MYGNLVYVDIVICVEVEMGVLVEWGMLMLGTWDIGILIRGDGDMWDKLTWIYWDVG